MSFRRCLQSKRLSRLPGRGERNNQTETGSSLSWFFFPLPVFSAIRRALRACLLVALSALSLSLGAFDLHRGGLHGDSSEDLAWRPRATFVSHGGPTHLCRADVLVQRPCPGCVHRLQTSGAHLLESVCAVPLVAQGRVLAAAPPRAGRPVLRSCSARGPPSR